MLRSIIDENVIPFETATRHRSVVLRYPQPLVQPYLTKESKKQRAGFGGVVLVYESDPNPDARWSCRPSGVY